jgi:signal transduction histidine kinase
MKKNLAGIMAVLAIMLGLTSGTVSCSNDVPLTMDLTIEVSNSRVVKAAVHTAAAGLGEILADIEDEEAQIAVIQKFIEPVRFFNDESGYFYAYRYNCVNVAHAIDKTLVGQDLTEYQDSREMFVIQELSDAAAYGGGFVTFYWPHPETREEQEKIGYVEPIPGTDFFIGTGYYPDTE